MKVTIDVPAESAEHLKKLSQVKPKALEFLASLSSNKKAVETLCNPLTQMVIKQKLT